MNEVSLGFFLPGTNTNLSSFSTRFLLAVRRDVDAADGAVFALEFDARDLVVRGGGNGSLCVKLVGESEVELEWMGLRTYPPEVRPHPCGRRPLHRPLHDCRRAAHDERAQHPAFSCALH